MKFQLPRKSKINNNIDKMINHTKQSPETKIERPTRMWSIYFNKVEEEVPTNSVE